MNIKGILKSKLVTQWGVLVLILSILLSSVIISDAWFSPLIKKNPWDLMTSYPDEVSDIYTSADKLPMDMLFGTSKAAVRYVGEVREQDITKINNGSVPYREEDKFWEKSDVKSKSIEMSPIQEGTEPEEYINPGTDLFEPRLYILSQARASNVWRYVGEVFTGAIKLVTRLIAQIDNLLIKAKNISATKILASLKMDKLLDIINKIFVKSDDGTWSIFFILALISFIFCLVGVAWRYVTGKQKKQTAISLFISAIIGLGLLFLSYSNATGVLALSDKLALAVDNLIVNTSQSGSDNPDNNWWEVDIKNDETETLALRESSLLNKMMIDAQLNSQFNNTSLWNNEPFYSKSTMSGTLGTGFKTLGEWFWASHSPVSFSKGENKNQIQTHVLNREFMSYDQQVIRMDTMIEALEDSYGSATSKQKKEIIKIYDGFANPSAWGVSIDFILLQVIFVLLFLCLWQFVLRILLGKMLAGAFWIGLPAAGILYLSGREKLQKRGKMIAFIGITSAIQVFLLSVVFDLVLIITGILVSSTKGEFYGYLLVIAFLSFVLMNIKRIITFLERLLDSINNMFSPELNRATKAFKAQARSRISAFNRWNDNRDKDAFVEDGDGNVHKIKVKNKGSIGSMLGHAVEEGFSDNVNRQGILKIGREGWKARRDAKTQALEELALKLQQENNEKIADLEGELKSLKDTAYSNSDAETDEEKYEALKEDLEGLGINTEELKKKKEATQKAEDRIKILEDRTRVLKDREGFRTPEEDRELEEKQKELEEQKQYVSNLKSNIVREIDDAINKKFNDILGKDDSLLHNMIFERTQLQEILKRGKNLSENDIKTYAEKIEVLKKRIQGYTEADRDILLHASLNTEEKLKAHDDALKTYETHRAYMNHKVLQKEIDDSKRAQEEQGHINKNDTQLRSLLEAERIKQGKATYLEEAEIAGAKLMTEVNRLARKKSQEEAQSIMTGKKEEIFNDNKKQLESDLYDYMAIMGTGDVEKAHRKLQNLPQDVAEDLTQKLLSSDGFGSYQKALKEGDMAKAGIAHTAMRNTVSELINNDSVVKDTLTKQTEDEYSSKLSAKENELFEKHMYNVHAGLQNDALAGRESVETTAKSFTYIAKELDGGKALMEFANATDSEYQVKNFHTAINKAIEDAGLKRPEPIEEATPTSTGAFRIKEKQENTMEAYKGQVQLAGGYSVAEYEDAVRRGIAEYQNNLNIPSSEKSKTYSPEEINSMVMEASDYINKEIENGYKMEIGDIASMVAHRGRILTDADKEQLKRELDNERYVENFGNNNASNTTIKNNTSEVNVNAIAEEAAKKVQLNTQNNGGKQPETEKVVVNNDAELGELRERVDKMENREVKTEPSIIEKTVETRVETAEIDNKMLDEWLKNNSQLSQNTEPQIIEKTVEKETVVEKVVENNSNPDIEAKIKEQQEEINILKANQGKTTEKETVVETIIKEGEGKNTAEENIRNAVNEANVETPKPEKEKEPSKTDKTSSGEKLKKKWKVK